MEVFCAQHVQCAELESEEKRHFSAMKCTLWWFLRVFVPRWADKSSLLEEMRQGAQQVGERGES